MATLPAKYRQKKAAPRTIKYRRPWLYPKQERFLFAPARYSVVEATTKSGKAQPLDATVYTPRGPARMGDLAPGDVVLTPDGTDRIHAIHPQGVVDIYRLTFSDGAVVEACGDHLWAVERATARPHLATTRDLAALTPQTLRRTWIPQAQPVAFGSQPVPLDPWLLGVLIGDGGMTTESLRLSSVDTELLDRVRAVLPAGVTLRHAGRCDYAITTGRPGYRENPVIHALRALGLWGAGSHEKQIPDIYRYNSVHVRREVLRGIMDADGSVEAKYGQPRLEQTSGTLATHVTELVESLGGSVITRVKRASSYCDAMGRRVACRPVYRQTIRMPDARECFWLSRKRAAARKRSKPVRRTLRSITFAHRAEAQCLELDDPIGLYLTDRFVVTHNTAGCLIWLNELACLQGRPGWHGWWVAPVYPQARIAYRRLRRSARRFGDLLKFNDSELTVRYPNGATLWFRSAERPDHLYGEDVHAAVFDEATRGREEAWHALRSTLTYTRAPVRIIGNVRGRKNWAFQLAREAEEEMARHPDGSATFYYAKLTAWDAVASGILAREEVLDAQRLLPETVFRELYLAEPSEEGSNPFGHEAIRKATMRGPDGVSRLAAGPVAAWGVDLAKSIDWTVKIGLTRAGLMAGFDRYQRSWEATKSDLRATIGSTRALIDSTGVGDPIVEELQKGRTTITGFKFSPGSKQMLMEGLAAAIQASADTGRPFIYAGPGNVVVNELDAFEYEYTRTGVRYTAPKGWHDDTVCALALAVEQHRQLGRASSRGGALVTL